MLKLLTFKPAFGVRSPSPFCYKADALLTLAKLDFERVPSLPKDSPSGKLPALIDADAVICDSSLIQSYIENTLNRPFHEKPSPSHSADALAYKRMFEEHFYFVSLYLRWIKHPDVTKKALFSEFPFGIRNLLFKMVQRSVLKQTTLQGIARLSHETILEQGLDDLNAVSTRLTNQPYLLGNTLTTADIALYPFLVNTAIAPFHTLLRERCREDSTLRTYCMNCELAVYGTTSAIDSWQ